MATRRDQLQSYQFLLQRVVSALVYRKTDPAQSPFRRAGGAIFAGIMLSVLALAITAVIGLFATGCGKTANWKEGGAIIREKETGTLYVIFPTATEKGASNKRQVLYEAANFSSAALLVGSTEVFDIKSQSLRENSGVDMGPMVGIPGAPNSIPKSDALSKGDWTLCSQASSDNARSKFFIGVSKQPKGTTLKKDQGVFVQSGEDTYLVSGGNKHLVEDDEIVSYFNVDEAPIKVDKAFIDGVESGDNLKLPDLGKTGEDSEVVEGATIGTVFEQTATGNTTYWVAMDDGVAQISQVQALMIAAKLGQDGFEERSVTSIDKADSLKPSGNGAPPEEINTIETPGATKPLCAAFPADGKQPKFLINAELSELNGVTTSSSSSSGAALADEIVVEPGTGALVEGGDKDAEGGLSLVTASGQLYGIDMAKPSGDKGAAAPADALTALGYNADGAEPTRVHMPRHLFNLIPEGPQLSPTRAMATLLEVQ